MTRIVLAAASEGDWRVYRQTQWMPIVRARPEAASWSRLHFDVEEDRLAEIQETWGSSGAGASRDAARAFLEGRGARDVTSGPGTATS